MDLAPALNAIILFSDYLQVRLYLTGTEFLLGIPGVSPSSMAYYSLAYLALDCIAFLCSNLQARLCLTGTEFLLGSFSVSPRLS